MAPAPLTEHALHFGHRLPQCSKWITVMAASPGCFEWHYSGERSPATEPNRDRRCPRNC